jgi:hypothetical protein
MKKRKLVKLLWVVVSYLVLFFLFYFLHLALLVSDSLFHATTYALVLNFLNTFSAVALFVFSFESSSSDFIKKNLGGLGVRVLFMLAGIIIVIKFLKIDLYEFILVFFVFYFVQLFLEIRFFHNYNKSK